MVGQEQDVKIKPDVGEGDIKHQEREKNEGDKHMHNRRGGRGFGGRGPRGDNRDRDNQHGRDRGDKGNHRGGGGMPMQQQQQGMNPQVDLMAPQPEKKFTGRCRLFVGNLTGDISEDEFKSMFEPHGELSEVFLNSNRGFGFVRLVNHISLYRFFI